jgi:DNA invertase Pin-like site-specific DNA recombinase
MSDGRFVAYYRVSTEKQGRSGLGIDAQRHAVQNYLNGGAWKLLAEFTEIESGKRSDRPKLIEAIKLARKDRATLLIAKLDRLARNVAFIANLMEAGVEFVAVDMPHANRLTVHILSAVAEHERELISQRTKAALAAAKERGGGLRE